MRKAARRTAQVLLGAALFGAVVVAVTQHMVSRPSPHLEAVERRHAKSRPALPPRPASPAASRAALAHPPIPWQATAIVQALEEERYRFDAAIIEPAGDGITAARNGLILALAMHQPIADHREGRVAVPAGDWECLGPDVDAVLAMVQEAADAGAELSAEELRLLPWVAARAFARGDTRAGMEAVQQSVAAALQAPEIYSIRHGGDLPLNSVFLIASNGVLAGDSSSEALRLLLILDATGAPREALAEVLRALCEDPLPAAHRAWLAEDLSLELQRQVAAQRLSPMRVQGSWLAQGTAWLRFQVSRVSLAMTREELLEAWEARDGEALAAADRRLYAAYAERRLKGAVSAGSLLGQYKGPYPAEVWQYAADCCGEGSRPAPLEMARFVAAAMLFRRDHGAWPSGLGDVVPAYLAEGMVDGKSEWGVVEFGPARMIYLDPQDYDGELAMARRNYRQWHGAEAETPDDLAPFAAPGCDVQRFARNAVELPARPLFFRRGAADPCSIAVRMSQVPQGGFPTETSPDRVAELHEVATGRKALNTLELVGFARVPPESLLRLINPRRAGAPE